MQDFVFLKTGVDNWKVDYNDITHIEALNKYVQIFTRQQVNPFLVLFSLSQLEKLLPADFFCRIHRSYIVSLQHIVRFNTETVYLAGRELPIGKHYRGNIEARVTLWGRKDFNLSAGGIDDLLTRLTKE